MDELWAEVVLVSSEGALLGKLPPVLVERPWWQEVGAVVRALRRAHGLEVTVLRLLRAERESPPGGRVTYLAETDSPASGELCDEVLDDHPLRNSYARPGGPQRDLAWARSVLASRGLTPVAAPEQIKTWNLSSVWRIPLSQGSAWLKVVPPFFAHEGALIAALEPHGAVPQLLGHERGRSLLAEVPGEDGFHASLEQRRSMIDLLVRLVTACRARVQELLALGVPDFRALPLSAAIASSLERHYRELDSGDRSTLSLFLEELDTRWRQLSECALPDGLVHGDFHSGNVRIADGQLTLLDWADAGIGHPLLDQAAFLERVPPEQREPLREHFRAAWQRAVPGCDPARAAQLIAPIAAARQAVIYDQFLDRIEPSEHPYHRRDPLRWLARAAQELR
ncbi:MAG TPA: phosphotransferase [Polyangiaceae bacterium]|nr:phosphotransferase [Polyangiaceae bacterium]